MNIKDVVFTSYSFGQLYVRQQKRLRESILKIYPEANIMFWTSESGSTLNDLSEMPPGSKTFSESMYGFKVHCIKNCLRAGYKKIIFLDVAVCLEGEIDRVMELASEIGFVAPIDRSSLDGRVSYAALDYCGRSTESIKDLTIVSGSVYIMDFNNPVCEQVFRMWADMEDKGLFGSEKLAAHGKLQGHRSDEACLSLCLDAHGLKPVGFDEAGYHNISAEPIPEGRPFIFHKLHGKSIVVIAEHSIDEGRLPAHANILDAGCRDFTFYHAMRDLGHNVYPVDIDVLETDIPYFRVALSHEDGECGIEYSRDPQATRLRRGSGTRMMTLDSFSAMVGVEKWDLIKLDIEGAEYEILKNAKHPIASQVSVECHCHSTDQTQRMWDELMEQLSDYYLIFGKVWEPRHGTHPSYWDILLIAK